MITVTKRPKPKRVVNGVYEFRWNGCDWFLRRENGHWCITSGAVSYGNFRTIELAMDFVCGKEKKK